MPMPQCTSTLFSRGIVLESDGVSTSYTFKNTVLGGYTIAFFLNGLCGRMGGGAAVKGIGCAASNRRSAPSGRGNGSDGMEAGSEAKRGEGMRACV